MNPQSVGVRGGYVTIEGGEALGKRFLSLVDGLYSDEINRVFGAGASLVARTARQMAPKSTPVTQVSFSKRRAFYSVVRTTDASGRLRKSIISRAFKRDAVMRFGPGAFAQVNLKVRSGQNRAPYGHIVESGRKKSTSKSGKFFAFFGTRGFVKTKTVGAFSGRYFFRRAVEATSSSVIDAAAKAAAREIVKRYEK